MFTLVEKLKQIIGVTQIGLVYQPKQNKSTSQ